MRTLLSLAVQSKTLVGVRQALGSDIIPWLLIAGAFGVVNWLMLQFVTVATGVDNEYSHQAAVGVLTGYRLLIVEFFSCALLVRSKGWQLWALFLVSLAGMIVVEHVYSPGLRTVQLPLLRFTSIAVSLLCIARLGEYAYSKQVVKLQNLRVTPSALGSYSLVALGCATLAFIV